MSFSIISYLQNTAIQAYALFIGEKSLLDYYKALAVQISSRNKITLSNDFDIDKVHAVDVIYILIIICRIFLSLSLLLTSCIHR